MPGTPDLIQAYWSLHDARPEYERADAYYRNKVEEFYASRAVQRLLTKHGANALDGFNFARVPVDAVANKLYLNNLTSGISGADDVIEDIWDENEMGLEAPILHRNVCKFGDSYVMVWPTEEGDEEPTGVDLINEDPLTVRVFYSAVNPRRKTYAVKSWCEGEGSTRITLAFLYYADRVERWFHKGAPVKAKAGQDKWQPYSADGQESVLPNPLGFVPFFHFRTDRPYGEPEHAPAYGPQAAINKIVAGHVASIDFQSFPQRYTLAEPGSFGANAQGGDDDPFSPEDEYSEPESEYSSSQLEADPGSVWEFFNTKSVGQFDAASADVFLKPFDRYIKAISQLTETPFHYFDSTGSAVSGESRARTNELFYDKVQARQDSLGFTWGQLWVDVLEYLGIPVERVDAVWRPVEPAESLTDPEMLRIKRDLGVPDDQLLIEMGYASGKVEKWAEERAMKQAQETAASD
ncbi:phage portal protein [Streptomyces tauricus]|uniref:Phage portal protein n=1 Tax=Streptomyces tauricus TaxID=68274 RepID=A0ABZ1JH44_9ACTN|nr:phage portal protein [Streptomyces tauricus]